MAFESRLSKNRCHALGRASGGSWFDSRRFLSLLLVGALGGGLSLPAMAATESVASIAPFSATPAPGLWFASDVRLAGVASIENLAGAGGNLETNAPLPAGAVRLTTTSDDNDKAEIGIVDDYGLVADIVDADLQVAYSYYKEASGNAFAAPTLKLTFFLNPCTSGDGDCFVQLVYEPTWNQPGQEGTSQLVPTGDWVSPAIDQDTGLFWSTGGFGSVNSAGGPPLRTLADWVSNLDPAFLDASLVGISVGVGTFNQDQIGYFDGVGLVATGPIATDTVWDFDVAAPQAGVFVDFASGGAASTVQAGYTGVDGQDAADGTPVVVQGIDVSLASEGTETDGTGIDHRDRGALAGGQALSDLARDFAFAWGEDLVLTLGNLPAGFYEWTGYFHDSDRDQGVATLSLSTDGGTTVVAGPTAFSHSTTDDPERIESQRLRFHADGVSDVVIRISNSDLPTPQVRPILDGFDLIEATPISKLRIDVSAAQGPAPVQQGYVGVDGQDAADGTPVLVGQVGISLASEGVESGGSGINGRDRGALDASQPLSDLARDFAFAWGEDLVVTLDGLGEGTYEWTGYFHDNNVDQGEAEISVSTDGGATFPIGPIPFDHSTGSNPAELGTQAVVFEADGQSAVVIRISNPDLPSPSVRPILNGFDLDLYVLQPSDVTRVDFFDSSKGFTPTQWGFVAVDLLDSNDGSPVDLGVARLSVTSSGTGGPATDGRDRGPLDPGAPWSDLVQDLIFGLGENLDLTFEGLAPGSYVFTGVFHDANVDHGAANLLASEDGGTTFSVGPVPYTHSTGSGPVNVGFGSIVFESNGVDPVVVRISNPDLPTPAVRPILNGFALSVPEPSLALGLLGGVGLLIGLGRIRRR